MPTAVWLCLALLGPAGCAAADIDNPKVQAQGGASGGGPKGPLGPAIIRDKSLCNPGKLDVGPSPVRRISRIEYNNMVRDLLSDATRPADKFVAEEKTLAFNSNIITPVTELATEQYMTASEQLVQSANLLSLSGCSSFANDACAEAYIEKFAKRSFRGTLDSADRERLLTLYRTTKTEFDADTAVQTALRSVLLSPRFLYVIEVGEPGSGPVVPLTQHEVAGRLSLYLWRSAPDDALITAADQGALRSGEQVATQARRMLADSRAQATLADFAFQWLGLERLGALAKSTEKYPEFDSGLEQDFRTETLTFFREFVSAEAALPALFTAKFSYLNARLAAFYGMPGGSNDFLPMDLNGSQRSGILTHASVLATQAHPTKPAPVLRGKLVREQLLCQLLPSPPANVDLNVPEPKQGTTTSDVFREHVKDDACAACHKLMDPIGFGFANYDAIGRFNTTENGVQLDSNGEIIDSYADVNGKFAGLVALSEKLAASETVKQCFTIQNFRYSLGRNEVTSDACSMQGAYDAFVKQDFKMTELMVAIAASDSFRHRRVATAGAKCQ